MASKAKLAKALAEIADLHSQLGEAYTAYGALVDLESSKSVESGDDDDAGEVPRSKRKAGSGKSSGKGRSKEEDDDDPTVDDDDDDDEPVKKKKKKAKDDDDDDDDADDLPKAKAAKGKSKGPTEDDVRKVALKVLKKHGKDKVEEILGGKLADVPEKKYAKMIAALEAALDEDADDAADDDDDEPPAKSKKSKKGKKAKDDEDD